MFFRQSNSSVIATPASPGVAEAAGIETQKGHDKLESIGPMEYSYVDLGPVRDAYQKSKAFHITPEQSNITVAAEINAPAHVVWEAATKLEKRKVWKVTISKMEHIQGSTDSVGEVHSCVHGNTEFVHATIAIDPESMQQTERTWLSPPIMKDIYITMQAIPLSVKSTRCELRAIFKPAIPIISTLMRPLFIRLMKSDINKDMAGLKELCETGHVAAREVAAAR